MSAFQALEPQPTAEVLLHTTAGDLRLELFAKQAPLASRNFLQLCLDGYYDDTIFHRLVPGFIIQGGDPTGTGSGGESSFENGAPFADEFHSRLKFNRRGLLGMANTGTKNDNGSQFFLTLDKTPELDGKNTMFGRIEGETVYNLIRIAEAEVIEGTERPMYPSKVTGAEIVRSPFEDMAKREIKPQRAVAPQKEKAEVNKKPKRKAGKNALSFGGDEDEEGMGMAPAMKKPKFNPTLVSVAKENLNSLESTPISKVALKEEIPKVVAAPVAQSNPAEQKSLPERPTTRIPYGGEQNASASDSDSSPESEDERPSKSQAFIDRTNDEIERLKASMKRTVSATQPEIAKPKTGLEAFVPANAVRGRRRRAGGTSSNAKEESNAFALFNAFRAKLDSAPVDDAASRTPDSLPVNGHSDSTNTKNKDKSAANLDEEAVLCDLHFIANCQSCTKWDQQVAEAEEDIGKGWMSHALTFEKDRLGKDLEWKRKNEEELVVIDPREKEQEIKAERKKGKMKTAEGRRP